MAGGDQGSSVDPGRDGERSGKRKICWPHLEPLFTDGQVLLPIDFVISFVRSSSVVPMCPPFNWFLIQMVPYSNICYTFENQRVQGYDIPVCQLVPQSTGLQTQSNLTRRAGVLWQAGTHFFRIQTVLPKYMIPGTRVNQDHLLDRTEPDSTFALIIMQYEAIPYNTVKYNRANFNKDISSRSLSGNKLCSNTSSLSNSTWMTLPS